MLQKMGYLKIQSFHLHNHNHTMNPFPGKCFLLNANQPEVVPHVETPLSCNQNGSCILTSCVPSSALTVPIAC